MNFPYFLSQRTRQPHVGTFSATVTRIGVGSIALGVAVMLVAFGILFGFKNAVRQKIFALNAHIEVSKFTMLESIDSPPLSSQSKLAAKWRDIPNIKQLQFVARKTAILKTSAGIMGVVLKGFDRQTNWKHIAQNLVEGRVIQLPDTSYAKEICLSRTMAQKMQVSLGQKVLLYFLQDPPRVRSLKVVGIYETGLEEFDNQLIISDLRLIQRLNNWHPEEVGSYEIYLKDFDQLEKTERAVYDQMASDMAVTNIQRQYQPLFDWLQILDQNMFVFMLLMLMVASFNMVSILLVMMTERTPTIGLLKALGSANWQIRQVFIYNGLWMITWGLLLGNVVGLGLCWLQKTYRIIPLDPTNYFMDSVPIAWNWPAIGLINVGTLVLISLMLLLPTLIILRIEPVKAIIFKK